jgi:hypothetical protein
MKLKELLKKEKIEKPIFSSNKKKKMKELPMPEITSIETINSEIPGRA